MVQTCMKLLSLVAVHSQYSQLRGWTELSKVTDYQIQRLFWNIFRWRSCQIYLNLASILIVGWFETGFSFWHLIPVKIGENFNCHTQRFLLKSLRLWNESLHLTGIRHSFPDHEPDRVTRKLIHLFRNFNLWIMSQTVIGKLMHQNFMSSG